MEKKISEFKSKGEYPLDEEGTLYVSPYWKKAMMLKEEKRNKKIYLSDILIVLFGVGILYFACVRFIG